MITQTVKYKGFDGEDIEEVIRLNLTKAEFLKLDMKYSEFGGIINYLRKLLTDVKEGDTYLHPLIKVLDTLILAAYGQKTDDGKFIKKKFGSPLADEFETSQAYSELMLHLLSEEGIDDIEPLILGILPLDEIDQAQLSANREKMTAALNIT